MHFFCLLVSHMFQVRHVNCMLALELNDYYHYYLKLHFSPQPKQVVYETTNQKANIYITFNI